MASFELCPHQRETELSGVFTIFSCVFAAFEMLDISCWHNVAHSHLGISWLYQDDTRLVCRSLFGRPLLSHLVSQEIFTSLVINNDLVEVVPSHKRLEHVVAVL